MMHKDDLVGDDLTVLVPIVQGLKVLGIVSWLQQLCLLSFKELRSLR
jgi:hypothetical protein